MAQSEQRRNGRGIGQQFLSLSDHGGQPSGLVRLQFVATQSGHEQGIDGCSISAAERDLELTSSYPNRFAADTHSSEDELRKWGSVLILEPPPIESGRHCDPA